MRSQFPLYQGDIMLKKTIATIVVTAIVTFVGKLIVTRVRSEA